MEGSLNGYVSNVGGDGQLPDPSLVVTTGVVLPVAGDDGDEGQVIDSTSSGDEGEAGETFGYNSGDSISGDSISTISVVDEGGIKSSVAEPNSAIGTVANVPLGATDNSISGVTAMTVAAPTALAVTTYATTTTSSVSRPGALQNLFSLDAPVVSIDDLRKALPGAPIYALYSLLLSYNNQITSQQLMEDINFDQRRQRDNTQEIIKARNSTLAQSQKLANQGDWLSKAGTSPSGGPTTASQQDGCAKVAAAIGYAVLAIMTAGISLLVMYLVSTLLSTIGNIMGEDGEKLLEVASWMNPIEVFADAIVYVICQLFGLSETDKSMQILKMVLTIVGNLIAAIAMIAIGVALGAVSGGVGALAALPGIIMAIAGIVSGVLSIVNGALEISRGVKKLEMAKERLVLNRISANIERLKIELEVILQDIDMLIDYLSTAISDARMAAERAARIIKEYYETKRHITQNFRA